MPDFRCSAASAEDEEPLAGTAPTDTELLLVEAPGPWGHDALSENRLPAPVREHLAGLEGIKVLLLRRPGGSGGPGTRVYRARREGLGFKVTTTVVPLAEDLLDLDLESLSPHAGPLWLVCTNGRRDRCCAEIGRPIADVLSRRWPEGTWETTHLGGHRFSGTLLALPTGFTLGRLDAANVTAHCEALERGEVPIEHCRGRAGRPGAAQVKELHVLAGGSPDDDVLAHPGPPRRQSCGSDKVKETTRYEISSASSR